MSPRRSLLVAGLVCAAFFSHPAAASAASSSATLTTNDGRSCSITITGARIGPAGSTLSYSDSASCTTGSLGTLRTVYTYVIGSTHTAGLLTFSGPYSYCNRSYGSSCSASNSTPFLGTQFTVQGVVDLWTGWPGETWTSYPTGGVWDCGPPNGNQIICDGTLNG